VGRPEEAVSLFEKAIRLNPSTPNWLYHNLGAAQILTGDYQNAITSLKRVIEKNPNHVPAKRDLIIAYSLSNQDEIARSQMEEYLKLMPSDTIESWRKRLTFKNEGDKDLYVGALRKVGFPEHPPLKLPDKPSIAVLAFENMSGDPKQEYFSDGLSEEIITALSKTPKLFVIARNSSFIYKGKPVKVQQIGRELGVKYVLEGSVRKSGDRVRITAQLVDAQTGNHLWADRYDREMKDLFALQDEITLKVLAAVHIKLKDREEIKYYQGTDNLEAFLKLLQARWYLLKFTKAENILGRELAQQAIELDPGYAQAYQSLAGGLMLSVWFGLSQSPKETLMQAIKMAEKAVEIDESFENAHGLLAFLYTLVRKHDLGIKKGERAVSLNPNCADCYGFLGIALRYSDRPQQAIANLNIAMRLNPFPKTWYYHHLGGALSESNQYEEAIKVFKEGISRYPDDQFQRYMLAWSYIYAGREEDARIQAAEVLRINPKFSVEQWAKTYPHINRSLTERHMEAMRKAGLK
jgi:TolB-like protein/Tfp pilus assembly protein PilF